MDRRRIERRVAKLERSLAQMGRTHRTQRKARTRTRSRTAAIVGYTNAGKSTLLNRLTGAGVLVEDRLFATLDATTRRLALPGGETVLLTDTVGFIRKLPHSLVEAFRSTLGEVAEADLLIHLVDGSAPDPVVTHRRRAGRAQGDRRRRPPAADGREQGRRRPRRQGGRRAARGDRRVRTHR